MGASSAPRPGLRANPWVGGGWLDGNASPSRLRVEQVRDHPIHPPCAAQTNAAMPTPRIVVGLCAEHARAHHDMPSGVRRS